MSSPIAPRASGFRSAATGLLLAPLLALGLAGCKPTFEDQPAQLGQMTVIDPSERHPIIVTQEPANMTLRVPRGSGGLSPAQRDQVAAFLTRYRGVDSGNSKLVLTVPSGSANEGAAVLAVGDLRRMFTSFGFADSSVVVEPYRERRDANAPIRLSYLRFVAQGPRCGVWPDNLAHDPQSLNYYNFGCAQQHNLAAQIANPADLLGPRTMDPSDSERRTIVYDRYRQGRTTGAEKSGDERTQVKGAN